MGDQNNTMLGVSVDSLLNLANILYLFSVAAALIFSIALWRLSTISSENKDRELARYQIDAQERISKADEAARKAQENSALANEKAKALELETEKAKLETERLKARLAWRVLSESQINSLVTTLSRQAGSVTVAHVSNDPESLYLAIQIAKSLEQAKWNVGFQSVTLSAAITFGILIPNSNSSDAKTLKASLQAAGIPYLTGEMPPTNMMLGSGNMGPDMAVIYVGTKPQ